MPDIYEKYGITKKEVLAWAERMYPQFLKNEGVLAQLYLRQAKKVILDPAEITTMRGKVVKISEIKTAEWVIIEGLVGLKIRENTYTGCPVCMKKLEGEYCETCGKVEPTLHKWSEYIVGDNSGDTVVSFPPKVSNIAPDFAGKVLRIRGVLGDQGAFMGQEIREITAGISAELIGKKAEDTTKEETQKLQEVLKMFPNIDHEEIKRWHKERGLKRDVDALIAAAGYIVAEGRVVLPTKEPPKPLASASAPTPVPAPTTKTAPKVELPAPTPEPAKLVEAPASEPTQPTQLPVAELPAEAAQPEKAESSTKGLPLHLQNQEPAPTPTPAKEPAELAELAASSTAEEVDRLTKIFSVFPKLLMSDLKSWHKNTSATTPLEVLIAEVGAEVQGEEVVRKPQVKAEA